MKSRLFEFDDLDSCLAHAEMSRLFDHGVDCFYPLDGLWRAAGSPEGKEPKTWLYAAEHLIAGMASYFARLEQLRAKPGMLSQGTRSEVLHVVEVSDLEEDLWRRGDTFVAQPLAEAYCRFVDFSNTDGPGADDSIRPQLRVTQ